MGVEVGDGVNVEVGKGVFVDDAVMVGITSGSEVWVDPQAETRMPTSNI